MIAQNLPNPDVAQRRGEALAWFARRQSADWTAEHEQAFQRWLAADAGHAEIYARCTAQWAKFDGMPADLVAQMRRQLARDQAALARSEADATPTWPADTGKAHRQDALPRRRFLRPVFATAGAGATLGLAGYLGWRHFEARPLLIEAYSTERGQQKDVALQDGTRLRLDTATRLEVRYFKHRRDVRLTEGQAVFAVFPDAERPFHVLAGPVRVTVVGTRFSVRHTPAQAGSDGVQVAVEEGQVHVARSGGAVSISAAAPGPVHLTAGQQLTSDAQGVFGPVSSVPAGGIAPWREQRISFLDTPLRQALAELERYARTGLVVHDPAVAALRLTGTFDPMNRSTLRLALPRVLPVRLKDVGGDTEIWPAP